LVLTSKKKSKQPFNILLFFCLLKIREDDLEFIENVVLLKIITWSFFCVIWEAMVFFWRDLYRSYNKNRCYV